MKKRLTRTIVIIFSIVLIVAGASFFYWYRDQDKTEVQAFQKAKLPLLELSYGDKCSSLLHGYLDEMEAGSFHKNLIPLEDRLRIMVTVHTCGRECSQVIYQLRTLDGERLVDDGILDKWTVSDGTLTQELQLANLLEDGREYMLCFLLRMNDETVRYYCRTVRYEHGYTDVLLEFAQNFSDASFTDGQEFIVNYIQPNDTMASNDLSYINIHSRYRMLTWNGLNPERTGAVRTEISELSESQMTLKKTYPIVVKAPGGDRHFDIEEN
ncbi:MAG: hypothetical protein IKN57_12340, partial [Parasporobacterium sp.]|nr:hypothetical protein [Parasporobacterium sp.]